jgi:hypothetical protein
MLSPMKCLFSDENLLAIAQRFHSVANIDLSNFQSVGLTDNSICKIVADSPGLIAADLSFCGSLSEVTLHQLAVSCPKLKKIACGQWGKKMKDGSLVLISNGCPELHTFHIPGCSHITGREIS